MMPIRRDRCAAVAALALTLCACNTPSPYDQKMDEVETTYQTGDYDAARVATANLLKIEDGDYAPDDSAFAPSTAALLDLEMAMIDLAAGEPAWTAARADFANSKFQAMLEASYGEGSLSRMIDDLGGLVETDLTQSSYDGSDWEHVLCAGLAGIAELAQGRPGIAQGTTGRMEDLALGWLQAWQAEVGAAADYNDETVDTSAEKYLMTGLPFFLEGLCVEVQEDRPGLAEQQYAKALEFEKRAGQSEAGAQVAVEAGLETHLQRATAGGFASTDTARVWVFCMTDKLPQLEESQLENSRLIANVVQYALSAMKVISSEQLPTFKSLLIARPNTPPPPFGVVEVQLDGGAAVAMPLVTDLQPVVEASYRRTIFRRITRSVILRLLKGGITEGAKGVAGDSLEGQEKEAANWALEGLEALWVSAERPDTRSWRLLPRRVYCLRLELPASAERQAHEITIRATPAGGHGQPVTRTITCDLKKDEDSFVFAILPDAVTPTATYWSIENGESWVVLPGQSERTPTSKQPLNRDAFSGQAPNN